MPTLSKVPFNVDLLDLTPATINSNVIKHVSSLDVFEGASKNFHSLGLYSVDIFGQEGTDKRFNQYGYIDVTVTLMHPLIFKLITKMKSFYGEIMSSKAYAVWDDKIKQFTPSTQEVGETGYHYFMSKFTQLQFESTGSNSREDTIDLIKKKVNSGGATTSKIIVIPAAYRDMMLDDNGNATSDDINAIYYRLIAISNTIRPQAYGVSKTAFDAQTMSLQRTFNDLYEYLIDIIQGKNGFFLARFAKRNTMYGTRNVITAMKVSSSTLNDPYSPKFNQTALGLYQYTKSIEPLAKMYMRDKVLGGRFESVSSTCLMTDKKTLKAKRVHLTPREFDRFASNEGLESIISYCEEDDNRDKWVSVNKDNYLCLIYNDGKYVKVLSGIEEVPEGYDPKHCLPITYGQLLYYSVAIGSESIPIMVTRYPITGVGSIYASFARLETTMQTIPLTLLNEEWQPTNVVYPRFPVIGSSFFNSMSVHPSKLEPLGADHDGDTNSANAILSDEGKFEIANSLSMASSYIGTDGAFLPGLSTDTIKYVMHNLTRRV
jgi:hypothetical protein